MRAFRNTLMLFALAAVAGVLIQACGRHDDQSVSQLVTAPVNPYFPLAVGNTWTYGCTDENGGKLEKRIEITAVTVRDATKVFSARQVVNLDQGGLDYYYLLDKQGTVYESVEIGGAKKTLMVSHPALDMAVGNDVIGALVKIDLPSVKGIEAYQVENFSIDDPAVDANRRMEWKARYYAKGYGMVAEADGMGGECILIDHVIKGH